MRWESEPRRLRAKRGWKRSERLIFAIGLLQLCRSGEALADRWDGIVHGFEILGFYSSGLLLGIALLFLTYRIYLRRFGRTRAMNGLAFMAVVNIVGVAILTVVLHRHRIYSGYLPEWPSLSVVPMLGWFHITTAGGVLAWVIHQRLSQDD